MCGGEWIAGEFLGGFVGGSTVFSSVISKGICYGDQSATVGGGCVEVYECWLVVVARVPARVFWMGSSADDDLLVRLNEVVPSQGDDALIWLGDENGRYSVKAFCMGVEL